MVGAGAKDCPEGQIGHQPYQTNDLSLLDCLVQDKLPISTRFPHFSQSMRLGADGSRNL